MDANPDDIAGSHSVEVEGLEALVNETGIAPFSAGRRRQDV
jgi:hypothetical protein